MTPEAWENVLEVFSAALERSPAERAAFLDRACAGDGTLRREVEQLLQTYEADTGFLEEPVGRVSGRPEAELEAAERLEGRRVGPYRVLRRLGVGGMGAVYLAVRDDDQYRKHVALKLIRRGMDSEQILRRFRAERQILASLDHPHIARLLDGGRTDDLRPYVVMEYAEGLPLDRYCDLHRLPVADRLRLFCTVCSAVHYAHQNLVVHRDLKPSNVLVTEDRAGKPLVKLIDFGIAKLLNPDLSPVTMPVTQTDVRMMTPEYASPEQVRGEAVTTASDVYQLGVLLYELLTGRRPYRLKSRTTEEIARVVCEEEPEKPSTVVRRVGETAEPDAGEPERSPASISAARATDPDKLHRRLAGDLDTIVLKAMHKEPARRYASAEALAEDVQRHLDGLPVLARPETLGYRLRKFVRRNRWGVAAAGLVLASLLLGIGGTAWQARVATQERDRARLEARKAKQVTDLLVDLFQSSDPTHANDGSTTAREILDRGADQVRSELADQPEVQAEMLALIGRVYQNLGLYDRALPALEDAVAGYRRIGEDSPEFASALLQLANLHYRLGDFAEAEPPVRRSLDLNVRHYGPDHPEVASVLNTLALVLEEMGRLDEARRVLRRVVEIRRAEPEAGANLAANLNNLAQMLQDAGELDEAEEMFREAVEVVQSVWGSEHPYMAFTLNSYAGLHEARGDYARAEADLGRALEIGAVVFSEEHPFIAVVHHNRGQLLARQGDHIAASEAYARALELRRRALPADHSDVAASLYGLAAAWVETGRAAEAEPLLREALAIRAGSFQEGDWRIASVEGQLGRCLVLLNRLDEAEPLLLRAQAVLLEKRGADDPVTRVALQALADLFAATDQPERAARYRALLSDGTPGP